MAAAAEALETIARLSPDVLISDLAMPGEDGAALIRKLRARGGAEARVPAIALTACASGEDRRRALHAGFPVHLLKPVEPAALSPRGPLWYGGCALCIPAANRKA